jgi:hypothetical protein
MWYIFKYFPPCITHGPSAQPILFSVGVNPFKVKLFIYLIRYPAESYPVLAFVGPPAAFPVAQHNAKLQKYMKWSHNYSTMADDFIQQNIPERPFIGIHLRNGPDFVSKETKVVFLIFFFF